MGVGLQHADSDSRYITISHAMSRTLVDSISRYLTLAHDKSPCVQHVSRYLTVSQAISQHCVCVASCAYACA
eukprot:7578531-Pyramimonas_sp.AAC.1